MGYGEASIQELILGYQEEAVKSEQAIGSLVTYIEDYSSGVRDRTGTVVKITMQRSQSFRAGVIFNPSDEVRQLMGVQEKVACIATFSTVDITGTKLDAAKGRFLVDVVSGTRREYNISSVNYAGVLDGAALHFVIGLIAP